MKIYLDNNATTPMDSRVLDKMAPYLRGEFGNAGSLTNSLGRRAKAAVSKSRTQISHALNCQNDEIIFTSGATESINLALKGIQYQSYRNEVITLETEHKASLNTCKWLSGRGVKVYYAPVGKDGLIKMDSFKQLLSNRTAVVSIMIANNETGVIQPVNELLELTHSVGGLFFSDATQAAGKIPIDLKLQDFDLIAFSGHKLYGPKGVGALVIRKREKPIVIEPLLHGGGQENGLRSGTVNVPGVVGLGEALQIAVQECENPRLRNLRNYMEKEFLNESGVCINGNKVNRLDHVSNLQIQGVQSDKLILMLNNVIISSGSACNSSISEPSHVLKAMGFSDEEAFSSLRISLGRFNSKEEIITATNSIIKTIIKLRK